jgi:hypothetical protein
LTRLAQIEGEDQTMTEKTKPIQVSKRIKAPASRIFSVVSDPRRHVEIDGSDMLRGVDDDRPVSAVGDTFNVRMHRLGRDYLMINHVVEFEPDARFFWEPAPGDVETAGGDPSRVGIPAGYRWGFVIAPDGEDAAFVTEVFDCGPNTEILRDDGAWINGSNPIHESMEATLARIEMVCTS